MTQPFFLEQTCIFLSQVLTTTFLWFTILKMGIKFNKFNSLHRSDAQGYGNSVEDEMLARLDRRNHDQLKEHENTGRQRSPDPRTCDAESNQSKWDVVRGRNDVVDRQSRGDVGSKVLSRTGGNGIN